MEREEAERRTEMITNKLSELAVLVSSATGIEIPGSLSGLDLLIQKITLIVNDTNQIKGRLMTVTEQYTTADAECKASRDTIQRLVAEVSKFEKEMTSVRISVDQLKAERDLALNNQTLYVREIETYKERMNNIQTAWQATKNELDQQRAFVNGQSANYKQLEYDSLYAKNCLGAFKEQIANLLSDGFVKVEANEEQIKEKVKLLMVSSKDRGLVSFTF
jgi:chromosome segregation ATPase